MCLVRSTWPEFRSWGQLVPFSFGKPLNLGYTSVYGTFESHSHWAKGGLSENGIWKNNLAIQWLRSETSSCMSFHQFSKHGCLCRCICSHCLGSSAGFLHSKLRYYEALVWNRGQCQNLYKWGQWSSSGPGLLPVLLIISWLDYIFYQNHGLPLVSLIPPASLLATSLFMVLKKSLMFII